MTLFLKFNEILLIPPVAAVGGYGMFSLAGVGWGGAIGGG